jgi:hypothetical protein
MLNMEGVIRRSKGKNKKKEKGTEGHHSYITQLSLSLPVALETAALGTWLLLDAIARCFVL